jgi:hypothetical protein
MHTSSTINMHQRIKNLFLNGAYTNCQGLWNLVGGLNHNWLNPLQHGYICENLFYPFQYIKLDQCIPVLPFLVSPDTKDHSLPLHILIGQSNTTARRSMESPSVLKRFLIKIHKMSFGIIPSCLFFSFMDILETLPFPGEYRSTTALKHTTRSTTAFTLSSMF